MKKLSKALSALAPWYDWGLSGIERVDARGSGDGRFVAIDWLGFHLTFSFGRTPPVAD